METSHRTLSPWTSFEMPSTKEGVLEMKDLIKCLDDEENRGNVLLQSPQRHRNTNHKMLAWKIIVNRKWLFIGDSNLSKMPSYDIPHLQIESYPGAKLIHMVSIMGKLKTPVHGVEKVVLSVGISNRKSKPNSVTQLQKALVKAKDTFPNAEVWIPVINYCENLSKREKEALDNLNEHIGTHKHALPALPKEEFRAESDNIHWTTETAKVMFNHWTQYLSMAGTKHAMKEDE